MTSRITILDYGIGNIRSISNALSALGAEVAISSTRDVILSSDGLVVPGVGSFQKGMDLLKEKNLDKTIEEFTKLNKPLLGICLGMQLFFDKSFEFGSVKGLGLISGEVKKLKVDYQLGQKLPNITWAPIKTQNESPGEGLLSNIDPNEKVYFIHSYAAVPTNKMNIIAESKFYDLSFCAAIAEKNIYGCQFHPEKSGETGLKILNNFLKISRGNK